jgi:hypothetical protein
MLLPQVFRELITSMISLATTFRTPRNMTEMLHAGMYSIFMPDSVGITLEHLCAIVLGALKANDCAQRRDWLTTA